MRRRTTSRDTARCATRRALEGAATLAAFLLVLGVLPAQAMAQESKGERIRAAFEPEVAEQIEALVSDAGLSGVPAEPLFDKALEGAAKRVPPGRILAVLEQYSGRLQTSRSLLSHAGGNASVASIVAGADALQRGVPGEALRQVGAEAGDRAPVALVVLGDLTEAGVPTDRAIETVRQALTHGAEADALVHVPAAVRRLIRDGTRADQAARDVTRLMRDGVNPRRIHDRRPGGR